MSTLRPGNRILFLALALFLGQGVFLSCGTDNLGFHSGDDGEGGDDDDGSGGSNRHEPSPPIAWFDHAVVEDGSPQVVMMEPGGQMTSDVNLYAPVMLWFNESLNPASVSATSFGLRVVGSSVKVSAQVDSLSHARCVAISPDNPLLLNTRYEVFVTFLARDLSGALVTDQDELVLGTFQTTSALITPPAEVVAAFPPAGMRHQADTIPVIAFSTPMRPDDVVANLKVYPFYGGTTQEPVGTQFQEATEVRENQIWQFPLPSEDEEGGFSRESTFSFHLIDSLRDFLQEDLTELPTALSWSTQTFLRPSAVDTKQIPTDDFGADVNQLNLSAFVLGITLGTSREDPFVGVAKISEARASSLTTGVVSEAQDLTGLSFDDDLEAENRYEVTFDLGSLLDLDVPDGDLAIGAFVGLNAERSSIRMVTRDDNWVFDTPVQDTALPFLSSQGMGPPFITFGEATFRTDMADFRPFGMATEPIAEVVLTAFGDINEDGITDPLLSAPVRAGHPYDSGWFLGPSLAAADVSFWGRSDPFAPMPFSLSLTDAVGNVGLEVSGLEVEFAGFVEADAAFSDLVIRAVDAETLHEISFGVHRNDDPVTVTRREHILGNWTSTETITLVRAGYRTTTLVDLPTGFASIPMRRTSMTGTAISPTFDLNGLGTEGDVLLGHGALLNEDASDFAPFSGESDLPSTSGFGESIQIASHRPAWSSAFLDLANNMLYDEGFSMDPRRILEPASTRAVSSSSPDWTFSQDPIMNNLRGSQTVFEDWETFGGFTEDFLSGGRNSLDTFPVSSLPGLMGHSLLGFPTGTGVHLRSEALFVHSYEMGVNPTQDPLGFVQIQENRGNGWVRVPLSADWNTSDITEPFPTVTGLVPSGDAYDLSFDDVTGLNGATGAYRFELGEYDSTFNVTFWAWDIWVFDGAAATGTLTLPQLDQVEDEFGPLSEVPGTQWSVRAEAWDWLEMDLTTGFFFSEIARQAESWGWDEDSSALTVP
ncbi:MAG: Ig-like domain-containing protein [Planctomycetota bacterium]|nr:Ig-like domain-containing protein [Planctomycetota bacterium]